MLTRRHKPCYKRIFGSAAAAMALGGAATFATQSVGAQGLEEIIITAAKREQTLQDTPISVMVATGLAIEQAKVNDIADLQALVPTLRVASGTRTSSQSFIIRGFGSPSSLGFEPSVGVFVDGVFRARSSAALADLPKVERIEVLSGPQSTLFGKNASAGAISIVTTAPSQEFDGRVEASFGNFNHYGVKGRISGGVSDTLAMSVAGSYNKRDGVFEQINPLVPGQPDVEDRSRWNLNAQALWEPTDTFSLRVIADYSDIDEICCLQNNYVQGPEQQAIVALGGTIADVSDPFHGTSNVHSVPTSEIENSGLSIHANVDFDSFVLTSITAYRSDEVTTGGHVGNTSINLASGSGGSEVDAFSQEFRLTSTNDGPFSWILGGFYYDEEARSDDEFIYGPFLAPYINGLVGGILPVFETILGVPPGTILAAGTRVAHAQGQDNTDYSFFGSADYALTDALTATVGLNYTRDKKEAFFETVENTDLFSAIGGLPAAVSGLQIRPPVVGFPNQFEDGKSDDSDTTYQLRLAYAMNDSVNFYISHATGFKSSSWVLNSNSRPPAELAGALTAAGINSSNPSYGSRRATPEYSEVNEIGMKLRFDAVSLNIAVFEQTLEDFQVTTFDGVNFIRSNAGETSVDGVEFELKYSPSDSWVFSLAGTFLDPEYTDYTNAPPIARLGQVGPQDLTGQQPVNIHDKSIAAGIVYNHRFENGMSMYARADYQYESSTRVKREYDYHRQINNLGASVGLSINDNLSLQLWGRNLTDDQYFSNVFGPAIQNNTISGFMSQPRTYGASVIYDFN